MGGGVATFTASSAKKAATAGKLVWRVRGFSGGGKKGKERIPGREEGVARCARSVRVQTSRTNRQSCLEPKIISQREWLPGRNAEE